MAKRRKSVPMNRVHRPHLTPAAAAAGGAASAHRGLPVWAQEGREWLHGSPDTRGGFAVLLLQLWSLSFSAAGIT